MFSSDRILTVRELSIGQIIHSGFSGGFCLKWKVLSINGTKAFVQHGGTIAQLDGIQLRKWPTYRENECPKCDLQKPIENSGAELRFLKQDLAPSVMHSSFRFREAQFVMRRRHVTR